MAQRAGRFPLDRSTIRSDNRAILAQVQRQTMFIFLVATRDASDELNEALESRFADDVLRIADNQWLVSARLTTGKLTEVIDPGGDGRWGELIVVAIGNYSGWHALDTWEWINQKRLENRDG